MGIAETLFISLGLAMDAFAVSLGIGTTGRAKSLRPTFRLAFHFGLFQALMPVLGWLAGSTVADLIDGFDHWVAMGLLAFVGVRMIQAGLSAEKDCTLADPSRGRTLVMLCVATSIDAFAIGLSLAMLRASIVGPALVIGVVTASLSVLGLRLGGSLGDLAGKRMEILGGLLLIGIGVRILIGM